MSESLIVVLIIAVHIVNEAIRAVELLTRAARTSLRAGARGLASRLHPDGPASAGAPSSF